MQFGGRYLFEAPRPRVWEALNDAEILKVAIPGCTRIDWVSDSALEAEMKINLGVATPRFTGDLTLSDIDPAVRYTLNGKGRGGLLGLAHGAADISLFDRAADTELVFAATGGASGRILSLGKALIGSSAQRIIDGFFERIAAAMDVNVTPLPAKEQEATITSP
jgi:uncharacterized protein